MAKKRVKPNHCLPKAGRSKRQVAASDDAVGAFNEASVAKRPRGRPPKGVSVEPLETKSIATTAARRLRKAVVATQRVTDNISTRKAVATITPRASCRKRSRGSSAGSASDAAIEAPKRRSSKGKLSCGRSGHSSRSRHGGPARKARGREFRATRSE
ncbi:hypothetical protein MRX96_042155 [Rhipicephalus microplus]